VATSAGSGPGWGFGFRPGAGSRWARSARRLNGRGRWRLFAGVWLLYLLPGFTSAWTEHDGLDRVLRLVLLVAFCYVYVDLVARALTGSRPVVALGSPDAARALSLALAAPGRADSLGTVVYVTVAVVVLTPFRVGGSDRGRPGTLLVGLSSRLVPSWAGTGHLGRGRVGRARLAGGVRVPGADPADLGAAGRPSRRSPGWPRSGSGCGSPGICTTCSATRSPRRRSRRSSPAAGRPRRRTGAARSARWSG
jgi:hypothetical protein